MGKHTAGWHNNTEDPAGRWMDYVIYSHCIIRQKTLIARLGKTFFHIFCYTGTKNRNILINSKLTEAWKIWPVANESMNLSADCIKWPPVKFELRNRLTNLFISIGDHQTYNSGCSGKKGTWQKVIHQLGNLQNPDWIAILWFLNGWVCFGNTTNMIQSRSSSMLN